MPPRKSRKVDDLTVEVDINEPRRLRPRKAAEPKPEPASRKRAADGTASTATKRARTARKALNSPPQADPWRSALPEGQRIELFCFGSNFGNQLGIDLGPLTDEALAIRRQTWFFPKDADDAPDLGPHGIEDLNMGGMHTIALSSDAKVYTWGDATYGRLGRDGAGGANETPGVADVPSDDRIVFAAATDNATFFIDSAGRLYGCGTFKEDSPIGLIDPAVETQQTPVLIDTGDLAEQQVASVACGTDHVVVLTVEGHVCTFGLSSSGRLGRRIASRARSARNGASADKELLDKLTPRKVAGLKDIVAVWSGESYSFAQDKDGRVYGWGTNPANQLGLVEADGSRHEDEEDKPRHLSFFDPDEIGSRVKQIDGGDAHTLFLLEDGRIFVTGRYLDGRLGVPLDHPAIKEVEARYQERKQEIEARKPELQAEFADKGAGDDLAWIKQLNKELPNVEQALDEPLLLEFKNASDVKASFVSASQRRSLVVDTEGRVWTFGTNDQGGLGLGKGDLDNDQQEEPQSITKLGQAGLKAIKAVAGGLASFVLAVRSA